MRLRVYPIPVIILISLLNTVAAYGQNLSYKQYSVRDGLPGSTVYHTLQDRNGFIWFATNQGVSRFDGRTFRNFSTEDGLPDNEVMRLYLDRYNRVWCTTFVGIPAVFLNDTIIRFDECPTVSNIVEDSKTDSIYLAGHRPLGDDKEEHLFYSALNTKEGPWMFRKHSDEKNSAPLLTLRESDQKINFYFYCSGADTSTLVVKSGTSEYRRALHLECNRPFDGQRSTTLNRDKRSMVFYSIDSLYYADSKRLYAIMPLSELGLRARTNSMFCENDSTLWICTRHNGLIRIRNFLTANKIVEVFFSEVFCTSIMKDHENGYWLTTHNDGVYYIPNFSFHTITSNQEFIKTDVRCVCKLNDHSIAAGFANGNVLFINSNTLQCESPAGWGKQHKNNQVLDIKPQGGNNTVLIASDGGLYKLSKPGKLSLVEEFAAVKGFYLMPNGMYASASTYGLKVKNMITGHREVWYVGRTTCVTGINATYFWGTLHGAYTLNNDTIEDLGKKYRPLSGIINYLSVTPDSALWACTQAGVVILKNGRLTQIDNEHGILSNNCKHIAFDGNTAWISTNKGISRMVYHWRNDRLQYSISNITEEDGLITNDVNQTTTDDQYLWAATAQGISFFSKHYISQSVQKPLININRIVSGETLLPLDDTIRLQYPNNKLQIELSGISYRSGRNIQYEYRLRPLDSHWSKLANNAVEFPALPFGTFMFEVRAVDRWGEKSLVPKTLVIVNTPPFWKSNAFAVALYLTTALVISAAFYLFNRSQHRKKEHEYKLRKKMHELEMKALQAQMNPHFIFNCLTSIQYHVMRADIRNATNYLHKFSTLIRKTLQHSTSSSILLQEELKILTLYLDLEKLRLGDRMVYHIGVSPELHPEMLYIPSMIVQPYVENAIKHGISPLKDRVGVVTINFERHNDYIECVIDDNGPGIEPTTENEAPLRAVDHVSMGTAITTHRINTLNVIRQKKIKLNIINKAQAGMDGTGTIIYLSFPILTD